MQKLIQVIHQSISLFSGVIFCDYQREKNIQSVNRDNGTSSKNWIQSERYPQASKQWSASHNKVSTDTLLAKHQLSHFYQKSVTGLKKERIEMSLEAKNRTLSSIYVACHQSLCPVGGQFLANFPIFYTRQLKSK